MQQKEFVFDNILCTYHILKSDKPYKLLVHGYCCDSRVWEVLVPTLAKDYSLIIPDLIGYGSSQLGYTYTMEYLASYLAAIIEMEQIKSVHLIGHSMGGYIGLEFLDKYPQNLDRLTLLNSHPYTDSDEKTTNREKTISFLEKHGSNIYVNEIYKTLFSKSYYEGHLPQINELKSRAKAYKVETLIQSCWGMIERRDHSKTLKNAKIPIQFILGKMDSLIPLHDYLKQCALPSIASIHLIEKMGHMGMLEEWDATLFHISSFSSLGNS